MKYSQELKDAFKAASGIISKWPDWKKCYSLGPVPRAPTIEEIKEKAKSINEIKSK